MSRNKSLIHFAGFFLLTLVALGLLRSGVIANAQMALWGVLIVQLAWGIVVFRPANLTFGNFKYALIVLVTVQIGQYATNIHSLDHGAFSFIALIRYFVFVALVEEIWFRGVLQDSLGRQGLKAVAITAVIFGLYHIQQGWPMVLTTASIGLLFSLARQAGAGILSLTLAHGLMNWLNMSFLPSVGMRIEYGTFLIVFPVICLAGAACLYFYGKRQN